MIEQQQMFTHDGNDIMFDGDIIKTSKIVDLLNNQDSLIKNLDNLLKEIPP
jgi:hypothetical protein